MLDEEPTPDAAASPTECSVTAEQLTAYLRRRFPDSPELARRLALDVVPGGRSKETILVSLAGTSELPAEVIVRKDRPVGLLQTRAADEFAILRAVYAHGGVPVARPLFADDAKTCRATVSARARCSSWRGSRAERRASTSPTWPLPPEHRRALGTQLATALAHLHAVPLEDLAETSLDVDASVTEATLTAAVERHGRPHRRAHRPAHRRRPSGAPVAARPRRRRRPVGPLCLLQGDVGLHNMLVEGDRVTALVDWEAATVGPPARELAAAWPAATALMDWPEFVAAYRAAGGSPEATDERAVTFYRVFFGLGACMSSRTGGHLFRTGAKRDLVTAHSGLDAHFRAQRNLVRALADAGALTGS